jgi:uncharacterized protein (TIGR00369 family)
MEEQSLFSKIMRGELPPPPSAVTLGMRFCAIDPAAGLVETECDGKREFTNPAGHIQGGFLAAMLDETMSPALAAMLARGEFAPTLNLNVAFHRPAHVGKLQGKGRVVRRGKDVCHLAGELYQEGELVASATATALIRKMPP